MINGMHALLILDIQCRGDVDQGVTEHENNYHRVKGYRKYSSGI
jgi:hypothetical protein